MKQVFIIKDTLTNKISYYHIMAFLVFLPFDRFYSELVLFSLLLHELIHLKKEKFFAIRMPMMTTGLIYLLLLAGTIYSNDKVQAYKELEKQLSLVLFPFIISISSLDLKKYGNGLMKAFTLTCIIAIIYLFIDALRIIRYNNLELSALMSPSFINHNFSSPISMHATIFSMYVTLSAVFLLQLLVTSDTITNRVLYLAGLLILTAAIFQLSSKAVFVAALIVINIVFPLLMLKGRKRLKFFVISSLASLIVIAGITRIASFKSRYIAASKHDLTQVSSSNTLEPRMVRWLNALELVKESPIIGYGTGTEINLLKEKYFQKHLFNSYLHTLNAHNQYLSFLLKTGLIGLAVYVYILYTGLKKAILARDLVFCAFIVIMSTVSFSENVIDVNKGIFFFGFFYAFFVNRNFEQKISNSNSF